MNVKIMLNKDEEINRLAADPEVEIRIKNVIVDSVGKRVAKSFNEETMRSIEKTCESYMKETLKEMGVKWDLYSPELPKWLVDKIHKKTESLVNDAIKNCVQRTFDKMAREVIEMAIASKIQELESIDPKAAIKAAADRIIRQKLGR